MANGGRTSKGKCAAGLFEIYQPTDFEGDEEGKSELLGELLVNAKDRKYQVWERNSLSVPLWTPKVFEQKLDYIHNNPVQAGLCKFPEDYNYSSAQFYERNEKDWVFLTHHEG
jgi:putative transposase